MSSARAMDEGGRSGPSARTRSRIGFVARPSVASAGPSTIPKGWRGLNSTSTAPPARTRDPGPAMRVRGLLEQDDLVDPSRGPRDLARLVDHHVVVVVLSGELQRGVPLPDVKLVGRLGRPLLQPLEEVLERGWDQEDEERIRNPTLDHGGALDVDLQDDVVPRLQGGTDPGSRPAAPRPVGPL